MKFVHVTSARSVSAIRRNGLRLSHADRQLGKGVYCVPLVGLPNLRTWNLIDVSPEAPVEAGPHETDNANGPVSAQTRKVVFRDCEGLTTMSYWRWLNQSRHARLGTTAQSVAVIFELTPADYPVELGFCLRPYAEGFREVLAVLLEIERQQESHEPGNFWWKEFLPGGADPSMFCATVGSVRLPTERLLGKLMAAVLRQDEMEWQDADFQLVVRGNIPARQIVRFVKLYEGKRKSREKRARRDLNRLQAAMDD